MNECMWQRLGDVMKEFDACTVARVGDGFFCLKLLPVRSAHVLDCLGRVRLLRLRFFSFCLIFVPFGHYDEPEILPYGIASICSIGVEGRNCCTK
jgi:hypothetical protein